LSGIHCGVETVWTELEQRIGKCDFMTLTDPLRNPSASGNSVLVQNCRVRIPYRTHPRNGVIKSKIQCRAGGDLMAQRHRGGILTKIVLRHDKNIVGKYSCRV
jgi:hypothetical protein